MDITVKQENQVLTVFLKGELDHHAASKTRDTIDMLLVKSPVKLLILDMSGVTFMDSSGIGLIVGRHNRIKSMNGQMQMKNSSLDLLKILKMSGIEHLMKIS